jgi:hypothetical protein
LASQQNLAQSKLDLNLARVGTLLQQRQCQIDLAFHFIKNAGQNNMQWPCRVEKENESLTET